METRGPLVGKQHPRETLARKVWHAALWRSQTHTREYARMRSQAQTQLNTGTHAHRDMARHTQGPAGLGLIDLQQFC